MPLIIAVAWDEYLKLTREALGFELFKVGDKQVYLSGLLVALIIFILGVWLGRRFAHLTGRQLSRSQRVNRSAVAVVERMVFYGTVTLAVLVAMSWLGLSITSFAFLGGAVAIGVGFGAQNIINNFISGLILMFEQPIRPGDMIEIEDMLGNVEGIYARFTRVRRTDGVDVLIPNSKLLENNVINRTLTDDRIRTVVSVGVAYGSPTDQVRDLILKAVGEQQQVIHEPAEPLVIFDEFGDNTLVFDVYFWTEARTEMQVRRLRSDIRFRIDALFREAGLVIAFPQRDVHLDTLKPLEVRLIDRGDGAA
jgi:small-conductance mechanosensitive channel